MNKKTRILLSVLAGVALCVGVVYAVSNVPPAASVEQPGSNNSSVPADRVDVVYFHFTQRCSTCVHAENMTLYTLETYFADELANGKVTFQSINMEDQANADIVAEYNSPSYLALCINTVTNGTDNIEEVTDIWYVGDEEFVDILKNDVDQSLAGAA
jgi:hypothetical protein